MALILAGDIGGTKTLLQLIEKNSPENSVTLYEASYSSASFPDLVTVVEEFLRVATIKVNSIPLIDAACFGIAGPVVNNTSELTNLKWSLQADRLASDLRIKEVNLINDFAAVGYGVLGLAPSDLHTLQVGKHQPRSPIATIGAGTGLGEGFLTWGDRCYQVHACEGGHVDFAPQSPLEIALLNYLLTKHERVSVERVVSGLGIVSIYQFLCEYYKVESAWEQGDSKLDAEAIANAAMQDHDPLCKQAMQMFVEAYGSEAGNLALKFLPYGGLYISGGIAPKILSLLEKGEFMTAFKRKGRVSPVLDHIPVYVVLNSKVGLIGAAAYAAKSILI